MTFIIPLRKYMYNEKNVKDIINEYEKLKLEYEILNRRYLELLKKLANDEI